MWIDHIKHAKSQDSFLKQAKENDQEKKKEEEEAKEKDTWVQAKHQLFHPENHICENRREPEQLDHDPHEFMT